jgi:microcystin-dependent protein
MFIRIIATAVLVLFAMVEVSADVPGRLHYNGFLTNAVGEPVDCPDPVQCLTSYDLTFRLYAAIDDTAFQWEESHTNLSFYGGSFHVQLGTVEPITGAILSGPMWLAIKINDHAEMSPRQRIVSAAFAIRAGSADQADNATQLDGMGATDYASATSVADIPTGAHTLDTNTQLTEAEVDGFVANNNYSTGAHTLDTNTQLTEAEVDGFVANNNYSTGAHTLDTNTQLTEAEVDGFVANNNYSTGAHISSLPWSSLTGTAPSGLPGTVPVGGIIMWSGSVSSIPSGWALCDGQNGYPDLRGRFIRGAEATMVSGGIGGADEITLNVEQLPAHNHSFTTNQAGSHTHSYSRPVSGCAAGSPCNPGTVQGISTGTTSIGGSHSHGGTTDPVGNNQTIDIRPAYYELAFLIRI